MRLPWQKLSEEEVARAFEDKTKPGPYDDEYVVLKNVNKVYDNSFHAVHDFNLVIKKKEFVVFVGPSGCGKSTTLRMIAGLEDISSGELYINGEYANDLLSKDRDIAMVFQNYALYPNMSIYKNLSFALKVRHFDKKLIDQRVHEAARILEIEDQLNKKPKELSGGQRQRVALGRAIVRNARIFLMDEPLSNLDAKLRVQMRSEIIRLHKQLQATTIYVTHDQTEAMTMADRIVVMKLGIVQQIGTPIEIYRNPNNLFVASFIGSPAMNLVKGNYNKGVISFKDGNTYELSDEQIKAHDKFYRERYVEETRLLPSYEEKLEEEKKAFFKHKHKKNHIEEFNRKYEEFIPNKKAYIAELEKIMHGAAHEIIFGIRPEDIIECKNNEEGSKMFEIKLSELLGDQYYLHFDFGEKDVLCKIQSEKLLEAGQKINIKFNSQKVHFFDPTSELSIK